MDQKIHRFWDAFLDRFLLKFGSKLVPGAGAIAGKSASWGGLRRPGNVAFICCPSWLRLGGPLNRIWDNFGTILAPKMAPKSDLGRIWVPKKRFGLPKWSQNFQKITDNPSTLGRKFRPLLRGEGGNPPPYPPPCWTPLRPGREKHEKIRENIKNMRFASVLSSAPGT